MFFTYQEQAVMMSVMWSIGNSSPITSGFLSYGVLWIKTGSFHPWKWLMGMFSRSHSLTNALTANQFSTVITGVVTIIFGVLVYLFFPDSPLHADFLTYEERAQAILRIKDNNSGIEQKQFKKHQYEELNLQMKSSGSNIGVTDLLKLSKTRKHGCLLYTLGPRRWAMALTIRLH